MAFFSPNKNDPIIIFRAMLDASKDTNSFGSSLRLHVATIIVPAVIYIRSYLKVEASFGCEECVVLLVPHLCHRCVLTKKTKTNTHDVLQQRNKIKTADSSQSEICSNLQHYTQDSVTILRCSLGLIIILKSRNIRIKSVPHAPSLE